LAFAAKRVVMAAVPLRQDADRLAGVEYPVVVVVPGFHLVGKVVADR
jgi:hypothetical protein